jgi:restriction system protein
MATSGANDDGRIDSLRQEISQLKQQVGALTRNHSTSIDRAIRPVQSEVDRFKGQLEKAQRRVAELEAEFERFQKAERERARKHKALKAGWEDARRATVAAEREIEVIDNLLADALPLRPPAFDELRDPGRVPEFRPGRLAVAEPDVRWEDYDPGLPRLLRRTLGLTGGHERLVEDRQSQYRDACDARSRREALRELELAERRRQYDAGAADAQARAEARNTEVESMRAAFAAGDPAGIGWFVREALERSHYPDWYPRQCRRHRIDCRPGQSDLIVEFELPSAATIPVVRRYEYDEHLAMRRDVPRSHAEISAQYAGLIASVALRTASEALAATAERADTVRTVTVNGRGTGAEAATGQDSRPHLISVSVTREALGGLFLPRVQPLSCLATLGARISPDPLAGLDIEPLEDFPESGEAE